MSEPNQSPQARGDLLEIWLRIARDNPDAADHLLARIHRAAARLAEFPGMGRLRPELAPGLHSFAVGNYVIFYHEASAGIEIVRVLHGARDLPPLFE